MKLRMGKEKVENWEGNRQDSLSRCEKIVHSRQWTLLGQREGSEAPGRMDCIMAAWHQEQEFEPHACNDFRRSQIARLGRLSQILAYCGDCSQPL